MWKIFLQGHILSTTGDALMHWRCCGTPQVRDRDATCWISDQMEHHLTNNFQATVYVQATSRSHLLDLLLPEPFLCSDWLGLAIFTNKHDDCTKQIWCNLLAASEEYMGYKYGLKTLKMCVMPTSSCDLLV
jgi:hypothetical protein